MDRTAVTGAVVTGVHGGAGDIGTAGAAERFDARLGPHGLASVGSIAECLGGLQKGFYSWGLSFPPMHG